MIKNQNLRGKPIRIGFYLENGSIPDVDFRNPEAGNPGSGGTEFLFVALPYYLRKFQGEAVTPVLFANNGKLLPDGVAVEEVGNVYSAARAAKQADCDFFVFRPHLDPDYELLRLIEELELATIGWAHITPNPVYLRAMSKNPFIKALVCVAREQYDRIQDSPLNRRLSCIVNGFDVEGFVEQPNSEKTPGQVTYIGALIPQKGFHLLAQAWPQVITRCPEARLVVIGSGALYDADAPLGPWGIAGQAYEEKHIIPFLGDDHGKPIPSVEFKGKLGLEKVEILRRTLVGVVNPSGHTEQCPGSALEFQAVGTPVVSGAYYGLLDTVIDGETGLLGRTSSDLVQNICSLLENPDKAMALGKNGRQFVLDEFGYLPVTRSWLDLISGLKNGIDPPHLGFKRNIHRHYKWAVWLNRYLQLTVGRFAPWPSVKEIQLVGGRIIGRLRNPVR